MSSSLVAEIPADTVLIRRFLAGEEQAFRVLHLRHTPRLGMTLRRLLGGDGADADDVVQDTWLAACRGMHGYRGDAKFSTWLTAIGVRQALAHLARRGNDEVPLFEDEQIAGRDLPDTIDIERALARLPDHQRVVVVLHDLEGYTHEEIGAQLGIATGTSKGTLSRARAVLRAALHTGVANAG